MEGGNLQVCLALAGGLAIKHINSQRRQCYTADLVSQLQGTFPWPECHVMFRRHWVGVDHEP